MSLSNAAESELLSLIFVNTAWANVGDAAGLRATSTAGSLYVALHTADPGEAGSQTTSEATYGSYARVAVARSGAGWTISGTAPTQAANAAAVTFPACTSGSSTCTYFSVGRDSSGAGEILWSGAITTPGAGLAVSTGITPSFSIGSLLCTLD